MSVCRELPGFSQSGKRRMLEDGVIAVDVIEDFGLEDEESAVDPTLASLRFLIEPNDEIILELQSAKTSRGPDRRQRRQASVVFMKCDELGDIQLRDAIAIRHHECLIPNP